MATHGEISKNPLNCSGLKPKTFWLTGLSGAGKSTIAEGVVEILRKAGIPIVVIDGDALRTGLNRGLGFHEDDRLENVRRASEVCRLFNINGLSVIAAFISPTRKMRAMAKEIVGPEYYREVFVSCPLSICESRDPKGLYLQARLGKIADFTGITAPYEEPLSPFLLLKTDSGTIGQSVRTLVASVEVEILSMNFGLEL